MFGAPGWLQNHACAACPGGVLNLSRGPGAVSKYRRLEAVHLMFTIPLASRMTRGKAPADPAVHFSSPFPCISCTQFCYGPDTPRSWHEENTDTITMGVSSAPAPLWLPTPAVPMHLWLQFLHFAPGSTCICQHRWTASPQQDCIGLQGWAELWCYPAVLLLRRTDEWRVCS